MPILPKAVIYIALLDVSSEPEADVEQVIFYSVIGQISKLLAINFMFFTLRHLIPR